MKTNASGSYNLPALALGVYNLRVEMPGFVTESRGGVKVGSVSEVVEVAGGAPVLQTETKEIWITCNSPR